MLKLHNVRMKPSSIRKSKRTTQCDKITVIRDVGTAQCEDGTVKCEKKVREEGTTQCDKRTVKCDVGTAQCEDEIFKCKKKK